MRSVFSYSDGLYDVNRRREGNKLHLFDMRKKKKKLIASIFSFARLTKTKLGLVNICRASIHLQCIYISLTFCPTSKADPTTTNRKKNFAEKCLHSIIGKPKRKYEFPLYSCHEAHNISSAPQSAFGSHQSNCRNKTRMFDLFIDRFTFPLIISHRPT